MESLDEIHYFRLPLLTLLTAMLNQTGGCFCVVCVILE